MTIVRWEPVRELSSLQNEMNRLFNSVFDGPAGRGGDARRWMPAMDLYETDRHLVLRADLPGVAQEDLAIEVEDGVLTVAGQRRDEQAEQGRGYLRSERAFGAFSRSLTLPKGIDPEGVVAEFDHGVLEVRVPKPEERRPRKIAVAVAGQPPTIESSEAGADGEREPAA
jgi:HSP20 family protein